jgi:hypothetical protein
MKNRVTRIKMIFLLSAMACFALAVLFRSGWWAMPGVGIGLMLWVLYQRDDVHKLSNQAIFFSIVPIVAIPALLQAGAGIFAFIAAGAMMLIGEQLRKRAKHVSAAAEGGAK